MDILVDFDFGCAMALMGVQPFGEDDLAAAEKWARTWKVPLLGAKTDGGPGVKIVVHDNALGLAFCDRKKGKPYFVDWLTAAWRARFQQPLSRQHIFRRALGADEPLVVFDATAGFGQDALMALSLGCAVRAVESDPVVFELLKDGLNRARNEDAQMKVWLSKLELVFGDSREILQATPKDKAPDVVFMDPMFVKVKQSAKSPKEMQLLQELLPPANISEQEDLVAKALKVARKRVVVKRPLKARALKDKVTHSYKGQSIRYDVYVVS